MNKMWKAFIATRLSLFINKFGVENLLGERSFFILPSEPPLGGDPLYGLKDHASAVLCG
jgi:hypothetical protein